MVKERRASVRNAAGWVLLLPFLLLSLISPAVMPARAADGTMVLILCTGDGPVETVLDLVTGQPVEKAPAKSGERCDWACGQLALADLALPVGVLPPDRAQGFASPPASLRLALSRATGLPPATGPPALS